MAKVKQLVSLEERLEQALVPKGEQPYPVPGNWVWTRLETVNNYKSCSVDPAKNTGQIYELYSVPVFETGQPEIIRGSEIGSTKQGVQKGDVLLCKINPRINRVWQVYKQTDYPLIASSEWIVVRARGYESSFLRLCLASPYFRELLLSNVSGVGGSLTRAQPKYVKTYPIPLPPLAEQRRIVAQIESLFQKLDSARDLVQNALDSFETRKAAILHMAFTGKLTAKWRLDNGCENEWERVTIERFLTKKRKAMSTGPFGTMLKKHEHQLSGIPVLGIENIGDGEFLHGNKIFVTREKAQELSSFSLQTNDIIISRSGTVGELCLVPTEMAGALLSTNLIRVTLNDNCMLPKFFVLLFQSKGIVVDQVKELCRGSTRDFLNQSILKQIIFPLPPLPEQQEIVRILDSLLENEQKAKDLCNILDQIDLMKKAILAHAFRGELGTNDPNEESALALLKDVLAKAENK